MSLTLDQPFVHENSVRAIHFFNGRLLSAEDLVAEQSANRAEHKQYGRALGDGIVRGLEVSVADAALPSVIVKPGLALNRNGRAIELADEAVVVLSRPPRAAATTNGTVNEFDDCAPPQTGVYILNAGVYLLTVKPTETGEGRAVVSGLGGASAGCNVKYRVSAVKFRLIALDDLLNQELSELQAALNVASSAGQAVERIRQNHLLRNRVAHRCFGTGDARLDAFISDPFDATATDYGLLANLRGLSETNASKLTDCEVPLAIVYWTAAGVQFLDMWSVRRSQTARDPAGFGWPLRAERRAAEGEAMWMQFQAQLDDLGAADIPLSQVVAKDWFKHLPPVGLLPIGANRRTGFDYSAFFSQIVYRPQIFIEGAQVLPLIRTGASYPAMDLSSRLVVWLYLVRENAQAALSARQPTQPYLIFASGHTPYLGEARYDVHRWDFGHYSANS